MDTIYWHMNAIKGGANLHPGDLHPGVNLLPGANLHPVANCAHERGLAFLVRIVKTDQRMNGVFAVRKRQTCGVSFVTAHSS